MNSKHNAHQSYEACGKNVLSAKALDDQVKNIHKHVADIKSSFAWSELMLDEFL